MSRLNGVIAAAATPLRPDLSIDHDRLTDHCRWLLDGGGCDGINLLGTTGEATSFSCPQRIGAMTAVAEAGLPLDRMMVGTGAASLDDAAALTAAARDLGFAGALLLPPFYYKGIDDDSLAAYVETLIERTGGENLHLYLYHIPQNTGVPYPVQVVERLRRRHPETIVGLKDSAGDLAYSRELAKRLPGFDVFPSSEASLGEARQSGFAGCISATTNVTGPLARIAWRRPDTTEGLSAASEAVAIREAFTRLPLVAALKWALAEMKNDPAFERIVPPLRQLTPSEKATLGNSLSGTAYPGLRSPVMT